MNTTIDGHTRLLGLLGWPVRHSLSPAMHNAAGAALGLNVVYVPLPVPPEQIGAAVRGLAALGFRGANVTIPHKQAVLPHLDVIEPAAQALGAVNTIIIDELPDGGRRLTGANTDWSGFLADLTQQQVAVAGRECLVLGAGGSARAVAYALAQAGGRVRVLARRAEQAQQVARDVQTALPAAALDGLPLDGLATLAPAAPIIVNTTPLGMTPAVDRSPWPADLPLPPGSFVYDLVYNPAETALLRQARAAGCGAGNGLGMLVHQAAQAFARWTGHSPDIAVMAAACGAG